MGSPRPLTVGVVLAWAEAHLSRTGHWPTLNSGPVPGGEGETWLRVDWALRRGGRGLPRAGSLALLLQRRDNARRPPRGRKTIRLVFPPDVVDRYTAGEITLGDIARGYRVDYAVARRELERGGVEVRGPGAIKGEPRRKHPYPLPL